MKLCGCKEPCFVNGEKVWGHEGGVLCLHASEQTDYINGGSFSICGITEEPVNGYVSEWQHKEAQQVIKRKPPITRGMNPAPGLSRARIFRPIV